MSTSPHSQGIYFRSSLWYFCLRSLNGSIFWTSLHCFLGNSAWLIWINPYLERPSFLTTANLYGQQFMYYCMLVFLLADSSLPFNIGMQHHFLHKSLSRSSRRPGYSSTHSVSSMWLFKTGSAFWQVWLWGVNFDTSKFIWWLFLLQ